MIIPELSNARARWKTCPFIHNIETTSGLKRSFKTIHFTCTTCTYLKKKVIFWRRRRTTSLDKTRNGETHPNRLLDPLIFSIIQSSRQFGKLQNSITNIGTLNPHTLFIYLIYSCFSCHHVPISAYKTHNPLWRRANARNVNFKILYGGQFTFLTRFIKPNYLPQPAVIRVISSNILYQTLRWLLSFATHILYCV